MLSPWLSTKQTWARYLDIDKVLTLDKNLDIVNIVLVSIHTRSMLYNGTVYKGQYVASTETF